MRWVYLVAFCFVVVAPVILAGERQSDEWAVVIVLWILSLIIITVYKFVLKKYLPASKFYAVVIASYVGLGYFIGLKSHGEEVEGMIIGFIISIGVSFLLFPSKKL